MVLLDAAAVRSDFVTHEISVLCARVNTEEDFKFFPIILDPGITLARLRKGVLGAADLSALQLWRPNPDDLGDNARLTAAIAAKIAAEIGHAGTPEPLRESLIRKIKRSLNGVSKDAFVDAVEAMGRTALDIDDLQKAIRTNEERLLSVREVVCQSGAC